jgi:ankyrin repeat protein
MSAGEAAWKGNLEWMRTLLVNGQNPDYEDEQSSRDGITLLMLAANHGHANVVELLLKNGANPNLQTNDRKETALMLAAESLGQITVTHEGHHEAMRLLLKCGADPNFQDKDHTTALIHAAKYGDSEAVRLLLSNDADPTIRSIAYGCTAQDMARHFKHTDVARLLAAAEERWKARPQPGLRADIGR